jgi:hypothetical protein
MRKFLSCFILIFTLTQSFTALSQSCCPQFSLTASAEINACKNDDRCQGGSNGGPADGHYACKNSVANYYVFPKLPGFTYVWTVVGGTAVSYTSNPIVVTWGNGSSGSLQVIVSNGAGTCVDTLTKF